MLPLLPSSPFVRNRKFVAEEWNALFASNATKPANEVEGGWQGVLYANLALVDPATSWKFFARSGFDYGAIDGGATRTWYLAFAAGELGLSFSAVTLRLFVANVVYDRSWRMSLLSDGVCSARLECSQSGKILQVDMGYYY